MLKLLVINTTKADKKIFNKLVNTLYIIDMFSLVFDINK